MVIGRVISRVVSSRKYENIQGLKLLVIQPCYGDRDDYFVAADELGAGEGELVLVSKGEPARHASNRLAPIDAIVVAIIDGEPTIPTSNEGGSHE